MHTIVVLRGHGVLFVWLGIDFSGFTITVSFEVGSADNFLILKVPRPIFHKFARKFLNPGSLLRPANKVCVFFVKFERCISMVISWCGK